MRVPLIGSRPPDGQEASAILAAALQPDDFEILVAQGLQMQGGILADGSLQVSVTIVIPKVQMVDGPSLLLAAADPGHACLEYLTSKLGLKGAPVVHMLVKKGAITSAQEIAEAQEAAASEDG